MQSEVNFQQVLIWTILRAMKTLFKTFHRELQPSNAIDCQVADEDLEAGTYDQMVQDDSVPFFFLYF